MDTWGGTDTWRALTLCCFFLYGSVAFFAPEGAPFRLRAALPSRFMATWSSRHDVVELPKNHADMPQPDGIAAANSLTTGQLALTTSSVSDLAVGTTTTGTPLTTTTTTTSDTPLSTLTTTQFVATSITQPGSAQGLSITFNCSSRASERLFTKKGPLIQYIHVPKTGGSTVQDWIHSKAPNNHKQLDTHYTKMVRPNSIPGGTYVFTGHAAIGWDSIFPSSAVYVLTFRDPFDTLVSLYDYVRSNTHHPFHKEVVEADKAAMRSGVQEDDLLNHHISVGTPRVSGMMWFKQFEFLLPRRWPRCKLEWEDRVRCALHNLLRCDVVAVADHLDGVVEQLHYHAPRAVPYTEKMVSKNRRTVRKQRLSEATVANLSTRINVKADQLVYSVAKRIAALREERAREYYSAEQHKLEPPADPGPCSLSVTPSEYALYSAPIPKCCRVA